MLAVRKTSQAFGRGTRRFLRPGNRKILAYLREFGDDTILCVANLSRSAQPVELNLSSFKGRVPVEMLGRTAFPPIGELPYLLTISAYGFYWFRLTTDADVPSWHEQIVSIDERPVLVLFDGWTSLFRERVVPWRIGMAEKTRLQFETDTLPRFIETQRWYAAKGTPIDRARIADYVLWQEGTGKTQLSWLVTLLDLEGAGERASYFMPLALAWEERDEERVRNLSTAALAKIRQQANVGRDGRRLCGRGVLPRDRGGDGGAQGDRHVRKASCDSARPRHSRGWRAAISARLPVERPRGSSSNTVVDHRRAADAQGLPPAAHRREPGTRDGTVSDRGRCTFRTARRWPACSSTSPTTARRGCWPCCRGTSPIRAMAGLTRSNICSVISSSIAPRRPAMPCPPMRMRRTWR